MIIMEILMTHVEYITYPMVDLIELGIGETRINVFRIVVNFATIPLIYLFFPTVTISKRY